MNRTSINRTPMNLSVPKPLRPKSLVERPRSFKVVKSKNRTVSPDLIKASERMKQNLAEAQEDMKIMVW